MMIGFAACRLMKLSQCSSAWSQTGGARLPISAIFKFVNLSAAAPLEFQPESPGLPTFSAGASMFFPITDGAPTSRRVLNGGCDEDSLDACCLRRAFCADSFCHGGGLRARFFAGCLCPDGQPRRHVCVCTRPFGNSSDGLRFQRFCCCVSILEWRQAVTARTAGLRASSTARCGLDKADSRTNKHGPGCPGSSE